LIGFPYPTFFTFKKMLFLFLTIMNRCEQQALAHVALPHCVCAACCRNNANKLLKKIHRTVV